MQRFPTLQRCLPIPARSPPVSQHPLSPRSSAPLSPPRLADGLPRTSLNGAWNAGGGADRAKAGPETGIGAGKGRRDKRQKFQRLGLENMERKDLARQKRRGFKK